MNQLFCITFMGPFSTLNGKIVNFFEYLIEKKNIMKQKIIFQTKKKIQGNNQIYFNLAFIIFTAKIFA